MGWLFDDLCNGRVLRIAATGMITLTDHAQLVHDVCVQGCRRDAAQAFLLDLREATLAMSVRDLYRLPELNRHLGLSGDERVALLFSDQSTLDARLYEARAKGLGLDHRVFTDSGDALGWLSPQAGARWQCEAAGSRPTGLPLHC